MTDCNIVTDGQYDLFCTIHQRSDRECYRARIRFLTLQLEKARELLVKAEDQGLHHSCAMEGHVDRYGCEECKENTEGQILRFLGASIEKQEAE